MEFLQISKLPDIEAGSWGRQASVFTGAQSRQPGEQKSAAARRQLTLIPKSIYRGICKAVSD